MLEDSVVEEEPEEPIRVRARRERPPTASARTLEASELAAFPRRNAEDLLRLVPGLTLVQHGSEGKGHQFFLRGFDAIHGSDLEVTLEGIPVNEWSNVHAQGYLDLGFIVPEAVESIQVGVGPFALDQGAFAMAGSADYRLGIAAADAGPRLGYTVGTTGRQRAVLTYRPTHAASDSFVAVEALHDEGFGENRALDRATALGRVRVFESERRGSLSLLGSGYFARFELPGALRNEDYRRGRVAFDGTYDEAQRGESARALLALLHRHQRGEHTTRSHLFATLRQLDLLENYTGSLYDPTNGDRRRQWQRSVGYGADVAHARTLSESWTLRVGAGVRGDVLDQGQDHVGASEERIATERALVGHQSLVHARLGLGGRVGGRLLMDLGVRADVSHVDVRDRLDSSGRTRGTRLSVSPRFALTLRAHPAVDLFASYGRGFRPPEARAFTRFVPDRTGFSEDLFTGGGPAMTAADSVEVGARVEPHRRIGLRAAGFATFVRRESVYDHVSGLNLELNATRRLGGELELRVSPTSWLTLSSEVTFVDARFVTSGRPIPLAPWLVGGVRAMLVHPSGLRAGLRFAALAPRNLPHGATGAPMSVVDLSIGYRIRSLRIDLEIENLLAQRIREGEYHFASWFGPGPAPSSLPVVHYVAGPPINARLSLSMALGRRG